MSSLPLIRNALLPVRRLAAVLLALAALTLNGDARAQGVLVDTGAGDEFGGLSLFNNSFGFQHLGGRFTLAAPAVIGTVQGWMSPPGGTLHAKIRANSFGLPGAELFSAAKAVPTMPPTGWTSFDGLNWSLAAGTYWVTFEAAAGSPGFGAMPFGAPAPLAAYAWFSNGNPGWSIMDPGENLGFRLLAPGGGGEPLTVPGQFPTIQAAIQASLTGQVIEVGPGTWHEALDFGGRTLTLRGVAGAASTIVDATGTGLPALRVGPGSASGTTVEGLTLRGGTHFAGFGWGAGLSVSASELLVRDCVLADNAADSGGGAAVFLGADVTFQDCVLRDNQAQFSGGGLFVNAATVTLTGCTISGNSAGNGGGINVNVGATLGANASRLLKNTATNSGGGLAVMGGAQSVALLVGCKLEENTAPGGAGAVVSSANATFQDCDFLNNLATSTGPVSGGGLQATGTGTLNLNACRFTANRAANGAGALLVLYSGTAQITASQFAENEATIFGGGLAATNGSQGTVAGCSFSNNTAAIGGGVWAATGTALTMGTSAFCGNVPNPHDGSFSNTGGITPAPSCTGWTDLGYALDGSAGPPRLLGSGSVASSGSAQLLLVDARPSSTAVAFIGPDFTRTPFKGGTLVPVHPLITMPLVTDSNGWIMLTFAWPAGLPAGLELHFQYAIQDPLAANGVALSNAIKSQAP